MRNALRASNLAAYWTPNLKLSNKMKHSNIEWTTHTFNPWIGCTKVSPGCAHCYAETLNKRMGWTQWGDAGERFRT